MPDPQTLQDELALRAQAQDPNLNAPWQQAGRQAVDSSMGFFKGITGLGDQGPAGPTAANAGALLSAAMPTSTLPETLIRSLMGMPRTSEATAKLMELLHSYKAPTGKLAAQNAIAQFGGEGIGGNISQPLRFNSVYNHMLRNVPEAKDMIQLGEGYAPNMLIARPKGFQTQLKREARFRTAFEPSDDDKLQKVMMSRTTPSVTSPTDLTDTAQSIARSAAISAPPAISQEQGGRASISGRLTTLAKAGLTEDDVRKLRGMTLSEARKLYPNKPEGTLRGLVTGDSYSWIK